MEPESGVTAVDRYFFSPIYYPRSAWSVLGWWESRRLVYNVAVGAAGATTLVVATTLMALPPHGELRLPPLGPVLVYALMANVCYSLGMPVDLLLRRLLGDRAPAVSQALFRYGFAFSVGLSLLPIPLFVVNWLYRLIFA